jgi:ribosomal protein S12 methylthiotransferase accessory factor YcaO
MPFWSSAAPAVGAAFLASLVEVVEASAAPMDEPDAVRAALAPENFLDTHETETGALIAADLAAAGETTSSVEPLPALTPDTSTQDHAETFELVVPEDEAAAFDKEVALP